MIDIYIPINRQNIILSQKILSRPFPVNFYLHHSEATTVLIFFHHKVFSLFKWSYAVCPLWIRLFSLGMASDLSICCASVVCPFLFINVFHCMTMPFMYLFFYRHLSCFNFLTVINKAAAINILAHIFLWTFVLISFE